MSQLPYHARANYVSALKPLPRVRTINPLGSTLAFRRDPLAFLSQIVQEYGDIVQFRILHIPMIVINHPAYYKHVYVDNHSNYDKDAYLFHIVKPVLRNGLIGNVGGESWLRQRRLMQPAFHHQRVAILGQIMTGKTFDMLDRWSEVEDRSQPLNITHEMGYLALQIVTKSLFSIDAGDHANKFEQAFSDAHEVLGSFVRFPFPPLSVPTPSHRRLRQAIKNMDAYVSIVINERLKSAQDHGDLLSMLMQTVDEETGEGMSIEQLHHEVLNIMIGAFETTTNALSWAWYLLSQHPEVEQRFHEELDTVLQGRTPTVDDLPRLVYLRRIVDETLRLYSPAWQTMRRAKADDNIGGYHIPANSIIFLNQHTVHRHPAFWEDPDRFDPDRFLPERVAQRPKFAYIPFGSGPRICIGNGFALTEIQLALALVGQHYRLVWPEGQPPVKKLALITLHPKDGVRLCLEPR
jgi:cytochrome P450